MIYKYGGYTLKNGKKEVKKVAIKIYSELNELIYDMLKNDIKKLDINGEFESVIQGLFEIYKLNITFSK